MSFTRRLFLGSAGALAAVELASCTQPPASSSSTAESPSVVVGNAKTFDVGKPVFFQYPDASAPAIAVRLSKPVPGGAGPGEDIVAYSQLCVHKGCPVNYAADREVFMCPCHFTAYDAEKAGAVIIGQATTKLPRITLSYNASTDALTATGVEGLIYGRVTNAKLG
jgi:arsenite oxidase small subunit